MLCALRLWRTESARAIGGGKVIAAPKSLIIKLRLMLQARAAECNELWREFGIEIARRDGEHFHRRGFMEIRERDGPGSAPRDAKRPSSQSRDALFPTIVDRKRPAQTNLSVAPTIIPPIIRLIRQACTIMRRI